MRRILGLDPGLRITGWGIIQSDGAKLQHIAHGRILPPQKHLLSQRLDFLFQELLKIIKIYSPQEAAIEEIFVSKNPSSTMKLGLARGVALLSVAHLNLPVHEYEATRIKKTIVGTGHATKEQISFMVKNLLSLDHVLKYPDAADALAISITHIYFSPKRPRV